MMNDDMRLVREYAAQRSESAFTELVGRHIRWVYSTALRRVGAPEMAEEVTQAVFIILARKAATFHPTTILPAWLHRTTRYAAADALKSQRRRLAREREAWERSSMNSTDEAAWRQIEPLMETAMDSLNEADRTAVVLRFYEGKSLGEVGAVLGVTEDAAKKRVSRALERLRKAFALQGAVFTAGAIAGAVGACSVQAVPAGLAQTVTALSAAQGAAAGGSTLAVVQGTLKLMAWAKAKFALASAAIVLSAGTAAVVLSQAASLSTPPQTLTAEVRERLRQQAAALAASHLEFKQTYASDTVVAFNRESDFVEDYDGDNMYWGMVCYQDVAGKKTQSTSESSLDGKMYYDGSVARVGPSHLGVRLVDDETLPDRTYRVRGKTYLDAAGFSLPASFADMNSRPGLQSLVLAYLERSENTRVETDGTCLKVSALVPDEILLAARGRSISQAQEEMEAEAVRREAEGFKTPVKVQEELAFLKQQQAMEPKRRVLFWLDPARGYAVAKREEYTFDGKLIVRIQPTQWTHYRERDIWLPGKCEATYYTYPDGLVIFSHEPLVTEKYVLNRLRFGPAPAGHFRLAERKTYQQPGTIVYDRGSPASRKRPDHQIAYTIGLGGTLLKGAVPVHVPKQTRSWVWMVWTACALAVLAAPALLWRRRAKAVRARNSPDA